MLVRFLPVFFLLFSECQGASIYEYDGQSNCAAQVLQMQKKRKASSVKSRDRVKADELVDLTYCDCSDWARKPYETIDQWHERIHYDLCCARKTLLELRHQFSQVAKNEREIAERTQELVVQNELLRQRYSELEHEEVAQLEFQKLPHQAPPFQVYLVKKGDTLYSIAMQHYGNADMVSRILSWNQGWLRDPESLIAGVGLVFFSDDYEGTAQEDVASYIRELEPALSSTYSR